MAELYGERIQTTVREDYLPYIVDTVLDSNVLMQRMVRASKKWSGRKKRVGVKISKNTTGKSFAGFDTFATTATDNRQTMEFTPSFYKITCALPGDELSVADTEDKVLDLMSLTMQSDTEDMADDLGDIFYADGTGNAGKDPLGLKALVDDGSNVATIGGLSRATYPTLQSTITASGGTLTLAQFDAMWSSVSSGTQVPTAMYGTETVYNLYGQLLRPQERITKEVSSTKGLKGGTGFIALEYKGRPVLADEKCTSGDLYFLNERYMDFCALPFAGATPISYKNQVEGNDYSTPVGLGFSWSDWIKPTNQAAVVGFIYFGGQFITTNPKRQGRLSGITGV